MVDDNFVYSSESPRYQRGEYATYPEALAVCRGIVDQFLCYQHMPGMPASALYLRYMMLGENPFIVNRLALPDHLPGFSASDYAKARCQELCAIPPTASPADA